MRLQQREGGGGGRIGGHGGLSVGARSHKAQGVRSWDFERDGKPLGGFEQGAGGTDVAIVWRTRRRKWKPGDQLGHCSAVTTRGWWLRWGQRWSDSRNLCKEISQDLLS